MRAIASIPPSQITPFHTEPHPHTPDFIKALFPNEHGLPHKVARAVYQLRHQTLFPAWLSRRFGGRTGRRKEETRARSAKIIELLERAIDLGHEEAMFVLAEISLVRVSMAEAQLVASHVLSLSPVSSASTRAERIEGFQALFAACRAHRKRHISDNAGLSVRHRIRWQR